MWSAAKRQTTLTPCARSVQDSSDGCGQNLDGLVHIVVGHDQRWHQTHNVALAGCYHNQPLVARLLAHAARRLRPHMPQFTTVTSAVCWCIAGHNNTAERFSNFVTVGKVSTYVQ